MNRLPKLKKEVCNLAAKLVPITEMFDFPVEFVEIIEEKMQSEAVDFLSAIKLGAKSSIRTNKMKWQSGYQLAPWSFVNWCENGYTYDERPIYALDPLFHAGAYYVQESSSMFLSHILDSIKDQLPERTLALDLCAAPGGKSTLLLDALGEDSILIANETIRARAMVLKENIIKWGRDNCVVINMDPKEIGSKPSQFDLIVVDAPCSGEGLFRKDPKAINEWSLDNVALCAGRQNRIIEDIMPVLAEGGFLIYSTCTFNNVENINNVNQWQKQYGLESVEIPISDDWGVSPIKKHESVGYHFYPHKVSGEGFFCAVLQKTSFTRTLNKSIGRAHLNTPDKKQAPIISALLNKMDGAMIHSNGDVYHYSDSLVGEINKFLLDYRVIYSGVKCGNLNKTLFIPDHGLAQSALVTENTPIHDLNKEDALNYLRRSLNSIESSHKSWILMTYLDQKLGWAKNLGNRINNYFPQELRIRNL